MSALAPAQFGDTANLLKALGLINSSGDFNNDWLGGPEDFLKTILADQHQRVALLSFIEDVRESSIERDQENRQWLDLFGEDLAGGGRIEFSMVVDDQPANEVHLFLGVCFRTSAPLAESKSTLLFPAFRARKAESAVPGPLSPELIGNLGGVIALTSEVTISSDAPVPGEANLGALGLRVLIPTDPIEGVPRVGLNLRGLQLPGEPTPRDLNLSLEDPAALRDQGLDLLVALLKAQAGAAAAPRMEAFANLFGLADDANIPQLPISDLFNDGIEALADWLAVVLGNATTRDAWLQQLANLFANGAAVANGRIVLPIGSAQVQIGVDAVLGSSGRPIVTFAVSFGLAQGISEAALSADLVRIDLGSGSAIAVPSLRAEARFDLSAQAMPNVAVDSMAIGFGLDDSRRPILIVELREATIFGTTHPRLDLTNPDAIAATAAQAATNALTEVLTDLGAPGDLIAIALGWASPPGAVAGYPTTDLLAFLSDPLGALRTHWREVLTNHLGDMPAVLNSIRQLVTGDVTPNAVNGNGTELEPWTMPLAAGLHVAVWRDATGKLALGVVFLRSVDTLGERCTVVETRVRIALVAIDLESSAAGFLPEISASLLGRGRGGGKLRTNNGDLRLEVDYVGIRTRWTPDNGLTIQHEAPNASLFLDEVELPVSLPDFSGDFEDLVGSLTEEHWDVLERVAALVASNSQLDALNDIVEAFGWRRPAEIFGEPFPQRLRLAALIQDPTVAIRNWFTQLLVDGQSHLSAQLEPLARLLSGGATTAFSVDGRGTFHDPWRVSLAPGAGLPEIALWREPDVSLPIPVTDILARQWNWTNAEKADRLSETLTHLETYHRVSPAMLEERDRSNQCALAPNPE